MGTTYVAVRAALRPGTVVADADDSWLPVQITDRNCNSFSDDLCRRLVGRGLPKWINRLAYFGTFVRCLLPDDMAAQTPSADGSGGAAGQQAHGQFGQAGASDNNYVPFTGTGHGLGHRGEDAVAPLSQSMALADAFSAAAPSAPRRADGGESLEERRARLAAVHERRQEGEM